MSSSPFASALTAAWLCATMGPRLKIWDLKGMIIVEELKQEVVSPSRKAEPPQCTSLTWSTDGQTLFAGYTKTLVQVWEVTISTNYKYMPEL